MKASSNNDDMVEAQEAEARKICPLLPPPEDIHNTFEAAMGWFWGPQRDFDSQEGIVETVVGYSGSVSRNSDNPANQNPTYRNVQDYAESIRVVFNPSKWTYEQLCDTFFDSHYPSSFSTQYRSAIFCFTLEQKQIAEAACKKHGEKGKQVAVEMASDFYRAEEYHQKYIEKQMSGVMFR